MVPGPNVHTWRFPRIAPTAAFWRSLNIHGRPSTTAKGRIDAFATGAQEMAAPPGHTPASSRRSIRAARADRPSPVVAGARVLGFGQDDVVVGPLVELERRRRPVLHAPRDDLLILRLVHRSRSSAMGLAPLARSREACRRRASPPSPDRRLSGAAGRRGPAPGAIGTACGPSG